ncbi:MAG TPA: hypothetical protein VKS22_17280 [Candidatus Binataceae bacterium]|nr:hypothetical protein [Candidatus Binataceae bacterium]
MAEAVAATLKALATRHRQLRGMLVAENHQCLRAATEVRKGIVQHIKRLKRAALCAR